MDIRSLVIMLLSIVAGGFLRFVISEPKVLFALAMVVVLLIVGYLSYYAGSAFKSRKSNTPRECRITALPVVIIFSPLRY